MRRFARRRVVAIASVGGVVTLAGSMLVANMVTQAAAEPRDAGGAPSLIETVLMPAGVAPGASPESLAVSDGEELTAVRTIDDADGSSHVRYTRTYQGLRVYGGDLVVHSGPGGYFEGASVGLDAPLSTTISSIRPKVTADAAKAAAEKHFTTDLKGALPGAPAGAPTDRSDTRGGEKVELDLFTGVGEPELIVDASSGTGVLAYEVIVSGTAADGQTPSRLHVLVDADTGAVRGSFDDVHSVGGTGHGIYVGTVPVETTFFNYEGTNTFRMIDVTHGGLGPGVGETGDMFNFTLETLGGYYIMVDIDDGSNDNVWGNGSNSNYQSAGVDAHYGAAVTYDYFKNEHGRSGIAGDGKGILSLVHYGNNYSNAFFADVPLVGGGFLSVMAYGDGPGNNLPFTALDVAGHEMSHGVTDRAVPGGLIYEGESGGLNEATSDIFATMVEFSAGNANDPGDYKIGEEIFGDATPLRFMYDPAADGDSFNCWFNGIGSEDVHFSSGVANHFYFMLAEGSGATAYGTSPVCGGAPAVTGIGRDKAADIWYRALDVYFTSTTGYVNPTNPTNTARAYTLAAASDLYGTCSTEYKAVEAAWTAVAVTGDTVCDLTPPTDAGAFVSLAPSRILDTRFGNGAPVGKVSGLSELQLQVAGRGGVPASGAGAVVLNVTITEPGSAGHLTVYPTGETKPLASNLNFSPGQTIPNLVTVKLGTDGKVQLANGAVGSVHLLADVAGYYIGGDPEEPGTFVPLSPFRLIDTRPSQGGDGPVDGLSGVDVPVAGVGGVPLTDAVAVVLNVTVTEPDGPGYLTVFPTGEEPPLASNLNFGTGQTIPNLVTVLLGVDGEVTLYNGSPTELHVIADIAGYYKAGTPTVEGAFVSLPPARVLDTRPSQGGAGKVGAFGEIGVQIAGEGGVPGGTTAETVILNVTVTEPTQPGYITVFPNGIVPPLASNLNFSPGQTIPNLTITRLGTSTGMVSLFNGSPGQSHLIADVAGYFL